jgi:hypothetical protein
MEDPGFPIHPPFRAFYAHSMLFNARSAMRSIEIVHSVVKHLEKVGLEVAEKQIDTHDVLDQLQNIVVQGASLSRYFWPVRKGHEKRAEQLRESFKMTEQSPLFSRDLRNEIEHFDERLDKYLSKGAIGVFLPEYFGLKPESDGRPFHLFRAYYVDVGEFHLLGNGYSMIPIVEEILRLHNKLAGRNTRS